MSRICDWVRLRRCWVSRNNACTLGAVSNSDWAVRSVCSSRDRRPQRRICDSGASCWSAWIASLCSACRRTPRRPVPKRRRGLRQLSYHLVIETIIKSTLYKIMSVSNWASCYCNKCCVEPKKTIFFVFWSTAILPYKKIRFYISHAVSERQR